jgi:hypothetical protein
MANNCKSEKKSKLNVRDISEWIVDTSNIKDYMKDSMDDMKDYMDELYRNLFTLDVQLDNLNNWIQSTYLRKKDQTAEIDEDEKEE